MNDMVKIVRESILAWQAELPSIRTLRHLGTKSNVHYNTLGKMVSGDWYGQPKKALQVMVVVAPYSVAESFRDEFAPGIEILDLKLQGIKDNNRKNESHKLLTLSRKDPNVAFIKCMAVGRSDKRQSGVSVSFIEKRKGADGLLAMEELITCELGYIKDGVFFLNEKDMTQASTVDLVGEVKMYMDIYNYQSIGKTGNICGHHRWSWSKQGADAITSKIARLYSEVEKMQKSGQYDCDFVLNLGLFSNLLNHEEDTEDGERNDS